MADADRARAHLRAAARCSAAAGSVPRRGDGAGHRAAVRVGDRAVPLVRVAAVGARHRRDEVVRGHQISQARVIAHVGDTEILTVHGALGERPLPEVGQWAIRPDVPPPEDCPPRPHMNDTRTRFRPPRRCGWPRAGPSSSSTGPRATARPRSGCGCPSCSRCRPPRSRSSATTCRSGIGQALGQRAGGNSLDNTLRVARRVPTDWVLADIRVHAVADGFGHGLVHLWAEDGTLLGTASQSTIVRTWRDETRHERMNAMTVPQRWGITFPFAGVPLVEHRESFEELAHLGYTDMWSAEAGGYDAFTPLALAAAVGARRCGSAPRSCPCTPAVPARSRRRSRASCQAAPGRVRARHRHVVERDRRTLERHPVREAVPTRPRHDPLPPRRALGREGHRGVRDVRGEGLPARRHGARAAADPRRRAARGHVEARGPRGRRRDHQLALGRRREDRRAARRRRQGDRRPDLRAARPTTATLVHAVGRRDDRRVPQRAGLRRVPRVARPRRRARRTCGTWKAGDRKAAARGDPRRASSTS